MSILPEPKGVLSESKRARIREALAQRGASTDCSRCGRPNMAMIPRATYIELQAIHEAISGVQEQRAPAVVFACTNCGWLAMHMLGALDLMGLLDEPNEDEM